MGYLPETSMPEALCLIAFVVCEHKSMLPRRSYPTVHARTDGEQMNAPAGYSSRMHCGRGNVSGASTRSRCLRHAVVAVSGSRRLSAEWVLLLLNRPRKPPWLHWRQPRPSACVADSSREW
jgi:hypothetical protein